MKLYYRPIDENGNDEPYQIRIPIRCEPASYGDGYYVSGPAECDCPDGQRYAQQWEVGQQVEPHLIRTRTWSLQLRS